MYREALIHAYVISDTKTEGLNTFPKSTYTIYASTNGNRHSSTPKSRPVYFLPPSLAVFRS